MKHADKDARAARGIRGCHFPLFAPAEEEEPAEPDAAAGLGNELGHAGTGVVCGLGIKVRGRSRG